MEPGDFILWDSRCVHYGAAPEQDNKRMAVCKYLIVLKSCESRLTMWLARHLLQAHRVLDRRAKAAQGRSFQAGIYDGEMAERRGACGCNR